MCKANDKTAKTPKAWQGMNWIKPAKRLAIYLRDGFLCQACGRDLRRAKPKMIALDHLRPRSKGGCNMQHNVVTICRPCNSARGNLQWTRFYPAGSHARVRATVRRSLNMTLAKAILAGEARDPRGEAKR